MRIVLSDFMSLDGVVQAPGGREEDTDGGFTNGGWSMPFFDPEAMGAAIGEVMEETDALLFGRRTWQTMAGAWPERAGDPFADQMNAIPTPMRTSGNTRRQIGVAGVISNDSQVSAMATAEKPNPMRGRGWDRLTSLPTKGASTPDITAIGAVSNADRVGESPHTAWA